MRSQISVCWRIPRVDPFFDLSLAVLGWLLLLAAVLVSIIGL